MAHWINFVKSASPAFAPPASIKLWLKSDTGVLDVSNNPISVAGTEVCTWQDQSGNSNDFFNNVSGIPTYQTGILNGYPAIRFDGLDDHLDHASGTIYDQNSSDCMFIVSILRSAPGDYVPAYFGASSRICYKVPSTGTWGSWAGGDKPAATVLSTNTPYLMASADGATGTHATPYLNGVTDVLSGPINASGGGYDTLCAEVSSGRFPNVDMIEIMCFAGLTLGEIASVHTYLLDKYGI